MISIDKSLCTGCKICIGVCPQNVLEMNNNKAIVKYYTNCMECGACELNCSFKAVKVTKGTGCLGAIVREDILKTAPKGTGCGCSGDKKIGGCC